MPGAQARLRFSDGFGFSQLGGRDISANPGTMKLQIVGLVHAVAYLRGAQLWLSILA